MAYSYVLCDSCGDINRSDWDRVRAASDNPFMDVRFLQAVENSITEPGKYWYAVVYDSSLSPVACVCFSLFVVDGAIMAPKPLQRVLRGIRKLFPWFFRFKILLCGLPVSTAGGQVAVTPDADRKQLGSVLDQIACKLARSERASLISFKEYDAEMMDHLSGLSDHGYRIAPSVTLYVLDTTPFASFDEYYRTRSKRTRANMRKVFEKFETSGLRCEQVPGGEGVAERYTDDVHRLYQAVFERAEVKFEHLPADFFREFARQLPESSRFTFLYSGEQVVGFCCALASEGRYDMLYCGIDYDCNAEADVYFNIMYRALEYGLLEDIRCAYVGASADEFKRRMGCRDVPLSIYVKAPGYIPSKIFNAVFPWVFH